MTARTKILELSDGNTAGTRLGQSATDLVSMHGAAPSAQRSGASQAAVTTTASTSTTPVGYSTTTQADALVTLVNEMRAALVAKGFIAGA